MEISISARNFVICKSKMAAKCVIMSKTQTNNFPVTHIFIDFYNEDNNYCYNFFFRKSKMAAKIRNDV